MDRTWLVGATALLGSCLACGCSADLAGTVGEVGEGVFRYDCVEDGDARCEVTTAINEQDVHGDLGANMELPKAVAVGGRFDLTYLGDTVTDDGDLLIVDVVPARTDVIEDASGFVVEQPGLFSFLARGQGYVADFVNLEAMRVESLEVYHEEQVIAELTLTAGQETDLAVVPNSDSQIALAGALPYTWTSSDATILGVGSAGEFGAPVGAVEINDDEVHIVAVAEGTATLTIEQDEITTSLTITVNPEPTQ